MPKFCAQWVSKHLTEEQKIHRMSVSMQHVMECHEIGNQFLSTIIAVDEIEFYHILIQPSKVGAWNADTLDPHYRRRMSRQLEPEKSC
ncbi:hypothetical protein TNCV_3536751 [Trichonephila clavipes]|uniref:Uncharacterized protein n=1 Tax=Trichonephila clavipes TaxID=2585209 RepID=A0A8X7B944_TRICX|nr:hypothetical protein TNCV_3536751 [Trichonephila clavipes]